MTQHSTTTLTQEQSTTQFSGEETDSLHSSNERAKALVVIKIPNTPFTLHKRNDQYQLTMGNFLITQETFETQQHALEWIKQNHWEVTLSLIMIVDQFHKIQQQQLHKDYE